MPDAAHVLPKEGTQDYNKLLRELYFTKHTEFANADSENYGKWQCRVCLTPTLIKQQKGSGLSALVRHVTSKHTDYREVVLSDVTILQ